MGQLDLWLGKVEVTNELGEQLDKQLQKAENQAQQLEGGCGALKAGAEKVAALGLHVSKDLEEGLLEFESPLKAAEYTRKYIMRAREAILNLAEKSKSEALVAHGKASGLREFMKTMQNHAKTSVARAEQLAAQAEELKSEGSGDEEAVERGSRIPGQHPGRSSLDERRAARDKEAAEKEAGGKTTKVAKKKVAKKKVAKKVAKKAPVVKEPWETGG